MKPNNILVLSVPHSGTRFVAMGLLGSQGYFYKNRNLFEAEKRPEFFTTFRHVHSIDLKKVIKLAEAYPTIVPIRRPANCAQSWLRRFKDINELEELYSNLLKIPESVLYLPIEEPDLRTPALERINIMFDLSLETDWQRAFHLDRADCSFTKENLEVIEKITPIYEKILKEKL